MWFGDFCVGLLDDLRVLQGVFWFWFWVWFDFCFLFASFYVCCFGWFGFGLGWVLAIWFVVLFRWCFWFVLVIWFASRFWVVGLFCLCWNVLVEWLCLLRGDCVVVARFVCFVIVLLVLFSCCCDSFACCVWYGLSCLFVVVYVWVFVVFWLFGWLFVLVGLKIFVIGTGVVLLVSLR